MSIDSNDHRVLSIQSHVVHGFVGNRCAVFPLQLHGFEVDAINSVQFSNHTAYADWKGQVLASSDLESLFSGLVSNNLHDYTCALTGYCGDVSFLSQIASSIQQLKRDNPDLFYICDPVLGDLGDYYVSKELMPMYRDKIIPLASVITPNQFELEQLSGICISSETDILKAITKLHQESGVTRIVITSSDLSSNPEVMYGYFSSKLAVTDAVAPSRFEMKKIPGNFLGTGDLFSALLMIWMIKTNQNLPKSVSNVVSAMYKILKFTYASAVESAKNRGSDKPNWKELELKLVQCQEYILEPCSNQVIITPLLHI